MAAIGNVAKRSAGIGIDGLLGRFSVCHVSVLERWMYHSKRKVWNVLFLDMRIWIFEVLSFARSEPLTLGDSTLGKQQ